MARGVPGSAGVFEYAVVLALLVAIVSAQIRVSGGWSLLSRHLWMDEIYTHSLVTDPSLAHALQGLAHGFESHPPAYYLVARLFVRIIGRTDEVTLRGLSVLATLVGLTGLYAALRLTFGSVASFAAVVAVWCHHPVMAWAFEARPYAAWLAGVAWLAYLLASSRESRWWARRFLLAAVAAFVCTVHYFGVLSLGLVAAFELVARRRNGVASWSGLGALACGPMALLLWAPAFLRQRGSATVATWVPPPTAGTTWAFFDEIYLDRYFALLAAAAWVAVVFARVRPLTPSRDRLSFQGGLTGLLLLPLVILALSWLYQPALVARYALPAGLGLGPVAAWLLGRMSRPGLLAIVALLGVAGTKEVGTWARQESIGGQVTDQLILKLRTLDPAVPVLFESPVRLYEVWRYGPDLIPRCALIDFEEGDIGPTSASRIFTRDLARRFHEFYGGPRLVPWREARQLKRAYLVGSYLTPGETNSVWQGPYPGFVTRTLSRELELFELVAAPEAPVR